MKTEKPPRGKDAKERGFSLRPGDIHHFSRKLVC